MGRSIVASVALVIAAFVAGAPAAAAQDVDQPLRVAVSIDGQDIADRTVELDPTRPAELTISAVNVGTEPRRVRQVRVAGTALALTFFAYDTTLPFEVPGLGKVTRTFPLDVHDLAGQAVGLLPMSVRLLDGDREVLGGVEAVADVRGSVASVYGAFGGALLVLTLLAWLSGLVALARGRLSPSRVRRALRFLPAGVGTGLLAVVALSVLGALAPTALAGIPVVLGAAALSVLLGSLTPPPPEPSVADARPAERAAPRPDADQKTIRIPRVHVARPAPAHRRQG